MRSVCAKIARNFISPIRFTLLSFKGEWSIVRLVRSSGHNSVNGDVREKCSSTQLGKILISVRIFPAIL